MRSPSSSRVAAAVTAITAFVFIPSVFNGWVGFDDNVFILKNEHLASLSAKNIAWMFTSFYGGHYHPLTWLSLALNRAASSGPFGFHLVDLALHAGSAALFFFIARRLLKGSDLGAAAAALFFSIHPLRVESVAWAMERRDVLSGFFYLAAVLLHLKGLDEPGSRWRPLSWAAFALSLLSKSIGITLPLALILLDFYPLKRGWRLGEKLPFFVLAGAAAGAAFGAEVENGAAQGLGLYPLSQRLATAAYGLAFYPRKTLFPVGLVPLYEIPRPFEALAPRFVLSVIFLAVLTTVLIARRKRWPAAARASLFYLITIGPVLGLVRFGPQLAADRYSYLSCLGWALLFGAAVERFDLKAFGAAALILLGTLTFRQTARWHDAVTLWSYALDVDPRVAMGQEHLGYALAGQGRLKDAQGRYEQAIALRPDYWLAFNNLGNALAGMGRLDEAQDKYREAIRLKPDYWEARSNLGLALGRQNRFEEAQAQFEEALREAPEQAGLHNNLGLVFYSQKKPARAEEEFRRALALDPGQRQSRMMLQTLASGKGDRRKQPD